MDIVYKATPRHLDVGSDDDDEEVIFSAGDRQDRKALMTGGTQSSDKGLRSRGMRHRGPSVGAITLALYLSFFGLVRELTFRRFKKKKLFIFSSFMSTHDGKGEGALHSLN